MVTESQSRGRGRDLDVFAMQDKECVGRGSYQTHRAENLGTSYIAVTFPL